MTDTPRKLATIVALDVAGYSARTEADEARTTAEVAALRQVIEGIAKAHGGRVFNTAGDGFMLEFASSLAAVEAAHDLAQKCEPKVRVGVHLGDVAVQPNGDLLGHGVNVAARLMARSDPGAALISADVRRTIRGPLAERLVSRGLMQLDKMNEQLEVFALAQIASSGSVSAPRPTEPILVVLPFDNLSNDPEMQFLSDGVSEEILQTLAHSKGLKIIGRTSAFHFRGPAKVDAARSLRATHILDGSVRKSGDRLRVSAQLSDGSTGASLWSQRYDRAMTEVFDLQDDIAREVTNALQTVFTALLRPAVEPITYELTLRAKQLGMEWTDDAFRRAVTLMEETVRRSPNFADAWAYLGIARTMLLPRDEDATGTPAHQAALSALEQALKLDPNCALAYAGLTAIQPAFANFSKKFGYAERAYQLAPGLAVTHSTMSGTLGSVGRFKESAHYMGKAAELEPLSPFIRGMCAMGLSFAGQTAEALASINDAMSRIQPNFYLWFSKFSIIWHSQGDAAALKFLTEEPEEGAAWFTEFAPQLRAGLMLPSLPAEQQRMILESILAPTNARVLRLPVCGRAAHVGHADIAYKYLFDAIENKRPIGAINLPNTGLNRSPISLLLFNPFSRALRADRRFPALCLKLGLVDYWRESGHWPDCADEVPYDFKAECEKAAREVAKA